ncbi:MAG: Na/Pi cotransporter family protein, partial [Planctomycetota bacterium]
ITNYALPAIGVGFAISAISKRQGKHWGSTLLGFGLLFFGLSLMKDAFEPLGGSQAVKDLMSRWADKPLLGVLIGVVVTMIIQSSSATIAVVQLLALSNVLTFPQALPIILGDNIGTTITAQIASLGTNVSAKRAARAHMMFNVLGVCILLPFVGPYGKFIAMLVPGEHIMLRIALSHTVFNVVSTLVFMPLAGVLAAIVTRMVPGEAGIVQVEPQYLEEHLLDNPPIALEQARREVVRMVELAASAVRNASDAFFNDDPKELELVRQKEDAVDNLQNKITQYLIRISQRSLGPTDSSELPVLLHSVNDIERMADHAVNLLEAAERKIEGKLPFTDAAIKELGMMRDEVNGMFDVVIEALQNSDPEVAKGVFESERKLNAMEREFRENHLTRLAEGDCNFFSGLTFVDCVSSGGRRSGQAIGTAMVPAHPPPADHAPMRCIMTSAL